MNRILTFSAFIVASFLCLYLCWANPPRNSFDNHYKPIELIVKTGEIPAKDACFQCYQPPVFYYSSAMFSKTLTKLGLNYDVIKSLQFLNCFYAILNLVIIYLILKRLPLSDLSRLISFSVICFLPRHIFMSAMHSNDSLTCLGVSLCAYLLLLIIDRKFSWLLFGLLCITVTLTIFVKYTAFMVIPMVAVPLMTLFFIRPAIISYKLFTAVLLVLLVPLMLCGAYMVNNYRVYGKVLPWNDTMINTSVDHPRDPDGVNFISFTPWQYINEPFVRPGQMHSFWTLIYSGIWVDSEPKFPELTDDNYKWWRQYYAWLRGEAAFPPQNAIPISSFTRNITSGLLVCGIVPLVLIAIGFFRCILLIFSKPTHETIKFYVFPVMLFFNAIGIIYLVHKAPVYSSMKALYFLNSLPAVSVFIALGIQQIEKRKWIKRFVIYDCCAIVLLATVYVIRISMAGRHLLGGGWNYHNVTIANC